MVFLRVLAKAVLVVVAVALCAFSGCAHTHLRWNTTHQARTLTDIYEQQVLDNLARFVHDPNALPSFAYPNAGGSDITDNGTVGSDTTWNAAGFASEVLKLGAGRNMKEAWTLTPIYDVRRLELMRCSYQHALFAAGLSTHESWCPNCDLIFRTFYVGAPNARYIPEKDQNKEGLPRDTLESWTAKTGRTTPACFMNVAWLGTGSKHCLPKNCDCLKKGHYCGTYVWVLPGGQDELTKLTLTILDFAFSTQAAKPGGTKDVTWYFNAQGIPVEKGNAAQEIKATVPIDAKVRLGQGFELPTDLNMMKPEEREKARKEFDNMFNDLNSPTPSLPPILPQPGGFFSPLQFELNQRFLTPQPSPFP